MDLATPARPLAEFADPATIASAVVLLAFVPFLLAVAVTLLLARRPGDGKLLQGRIGSRGIWRFVPRKLVAGVCLLIVPIAVVADLNLLEELLLLDWGSALAVLAVVLGAVTGLAIARRPWHKPLLIAAASVAAVAVVASILFAGQFDEYVVDDRRTDAPGASETTRPGASEPAGRPSGEPTGQPTAEPTQAPVQDDPLMLATPMGDFVTQPICLDGHGSTEADAVAVTVTGVFTIEARLPDGAVVQVGTARELSPCGRRDGAAPEDVYAPGKSFEQFDGAPYRIEGEQGMRVIARVTGSRGEQFVWVWRGSDGVTYHGLIAAADLRS